MRPIPIKRWQRIYDSSGYCCVYCEHLLDEDLRVWHSATEDHLYPRKYSGASSSANLVAACQLCNSLKGDFIPKPFADQPGVLVTNTKGEKEVDSSFRDEYIRQVSAEIERRRLTREVSFSKERSRRLKLAAI